MKNSYMSQRGICYDLDLSPYVVDVDGVKFFFSSKIHEEKFLAGIDACISQFELKFEKRYGIKCSFKLLPLFKLYQNIESRGFCIKKSGVKLWPDQMVLIGLINGIEN